MLLIIAQKAEKKYEKNPFSRTNTIDLSLDQTMYFKITTKIIMLERD